MKNKSWIVTLCAVFSGVSLAVVQNKVSPIMNILMETLNIPMNTAGLLSSIFAMVGILLAIPASSLISKIGVKKSGVLALCMTMVGTLIGVFTTNVTILIVSRLIEGTGVGIIAVLTPSLITMWFPSEKRGLPMGIWGSWMMIAQTIVFLLSGFLSEKWGWQSLWWLGLAFCLLSLVLFVLFVTEPEPEHNYMSKSDEKISTMQAIKSKSSLTLAVGALIFTFCSFSFVSWITLFWSNGTGWEIAYTQKMISLLYFIEIFYAVGIGYVLNKVKNRVNLAIFGYILYGIVGFLCFHTSSPALVMTLIFIYPLFDAMIPSVYWTVAPQTALKPAYAAIAIGTLNIGLNLGTLLSAPISGWFVENFGWVSIGYIFIVLGVIGSLITSRVKFNF